MQTGKQTPPGVGQIMGLGRGPMLDNWEEQMLWKWGVNALPRAFK